jgi:hypothetical protein
LHFAAESLGGEAVRLAGSRRQSAGGIILDGVVIVVFVNESGTTIKIQ